MNVEKLLVLASARGIPLDLGRPNRTIPVEHRLPPRRRDVGLRGETDPGIPGIVTALGTESRSMRAPEWTGPELGHAAKGMPERSWRALAWAIGQEQAAHLWLKYELLQVAVELKQEEAWPRRVHRGNCPDCHALRCRDRYLEDLCVLALAELAAPTRGWTDETRSRWFGTKEASWKRGISQCYQSLSSAVTSWYDGGIRHLRERLRGT